VFATSPLWTEYVSAFGGVVGIFVAGVALLVAMGSAKSARRSAEASESAAETSKEAIRAANAQLAIAEREAERIEAEQARRPAVSGIKISEIESLPGELAPPGVFRISIKNEGERDLRDAWLTVLCVRGSAAELVDRWGNPKSDQDRDVTRERWPGVQGSPEVFDYFARQIHIEVGVSHILYVRIPRSGTFPIRAKLFHQALEGGGPWIDNWVAVDDDSASVRDHFEGYAGASRGRLTDFDEAA
jgi:hypothetical protein